MRHKKLLFLSIPLLILFSYKILVSEALFLKAKPSSSYQIKEKELPLGALDKPLPFLGMGSQCLAFSAKESDTVLKICRASRYQLPFFLNNPIASFFFPDYVAEKRKSKARKRITDGTSYLRAYEKLSKQSGITFLHLDRTSNLNSKVTLLDPLGFSHTLPTDDLLFYLQKKAIPLPIYTETLLKDNNKEELKNLFIDLFNMVLEACEIGLVVKDIHPEKNIGICGGKPMWIDPGRIIEVSSSRKKETLKLFYEDLAPFFLKMDSSLEKNLQEALFQVLSEL